MASSSLGKRKRKHPYALELNCADSRYLDGNFAPIDTTCQLTRCDYSGNLPLELAGGQYVRNGGNPVSNADLDREAHWFDGDGMLSGVLFRQIQDGIVPEFVNQFLLTDVYLAATTLPLKKPILPSISTLVNPLSPILKVVWVILRTVLLVIFSRLPGSRSIKKISVANTSILYHDGRALATCESGPPLRVTLPELDTVGWFDGQRAEGEGDEVKGDVLGGRGLLSFMKEWTTGHPKVDPISGEMILFHATFAPPYVHYSVIPKDGIKKLNQPVAGIASAKMMHDFGVSRKHTIIMDLPLSLDPTRMLRGLQPIAYDRGAPSRFGVFPRNDPKSVTWFETAACCIFHTANAWDSGDAVELLACRMTSASVVFTAGDLPNPETRDETLIYEKSPLLESAEPIEDEQCRLYYYHFDLASQTIRHEWALSAIPFEFPSVRSDLEMSAARYVYGCTTIAGSFNSASLGKAAKIDGLVKFDTQQLIERGIAAPPQRVTGCVDRRTAAEVLADDDDAIRIFQLPPGHFAQEPRFVPAGDDEDDGYLLTYVFDEAQLDDDYTPLPHARSELWIIDARNMHDVAARVHLPQRVPYGLHGAWFPAEQVANQRPVMAVREVPPKVSGSNLASKLVRAIGG